MIKSACQMLNYVSMNIETSLKLFLHVGQWVLKGVHDFKFYESLLYPVVLQFVGYTEKEIADCIFYAS
jgi:hypothetical protein